MDLAGRWTCSRYGYFMSEQVVPLRASASPRVQERSSVIRRRKYRRVVEHRNIVKMSGSAYSEIPVPPRKPKGSATESSGFGRRCSNHHPLAVLAEQPDFFHSTMRAAGTTPTPPPRPVSPAFSAPRQVTAPAKPEAAPTTPPNFRTSARTVTPLKEDVPDEGLEEVPSYMCMSDGAQASAFTSINSRSNSTGSIRLSLQDWAEAAIVYFSMDEAEPTESAAHSVTQRCAKWLAINCNTCQGAFTNFDDFEQACSELGLSCTAYDAAAARIWAKLAVGGRLLCNPLLDAVSEFFPAQPETSTSAVEVEVEVEASCVLCSVAEKPADTCAASTMDAHKAAETSSEQPSVLEAFASFVVEFELQNCLEDIDSATGFAQLVEDIEND